MMFTATAVYYTIIYAAVGDFPRFKLGENLIGISITARALLLSSTMTVYRGIPSFSGYIVTWYIII